MEYADEPPKQAVAIEIACKHVDPSDVKRHVLFPMPSRLFVEVVREKLVIGVAICFVVCFAKKTEEGFIVREIGERRKLQARQRYMIVVEIDRDDLGRSGGGIVQNVPPAEGDRDQAVVRLKLQRLEIDLRIFPD